MGDALLLVAMFVSGVLTPVRVQELRQPCVSGLGEERAGIDLWTGESTRLRKAIKE